MRALTIHLDGRKMMNINHPVSDSGATLDTQAAVTNHPRDDIVETESPLHIKNHDCSVSAATYRVFNTMAHSIEAIQSQTLAAISPSSRKCLGSEAK